MMAKPTDKDYAVISRWHQEERCQIAAGEAPDNDVLARLIADRVEALQERVEELEKALIEEREESLWNAYNTGVIRQDGKWITGGMSDAEWLARECEMHVNTPQDPKAIQKMIPIAARSAIAKTEGG